MAFLSIRLCFLLLSSMILVDSLPTQQFVGHRVYKVYITPDNVQLLRDLHDNDEELDFWTSPVLERGTVDIRVPLSEQEHFVKLMDANNVKYEVMIRDLQKLINEEHHTRRFKRSLDSSRAMDLNQYNSYADAMKYVDKMAEKCGARCWTTVIGKSHENRDLKLIKIGSNLDGTPKPAVFIDAGIHAREWIAPATALNLIDTLVNKYDTDDSVAKLVDDYDWFILPHANPDGYEYSRSPSGNRMWRKTRSGVDSGGWRPCRGVDPNRNWDYKWMVSGSSSSKCSDIYAGPKPFSEKETQAMRDFVLQRKNDIQLYIALHAYGQYFLTLWGYTGSVVPSDYKDLVDAGKYAEGKLRAVHGTPYAVGSAGRLLYAASGATDDWMRGKAGIKWSYTMELRDKGRHGFMLPAQYIKPTAEETVEGIKALANYVYDKLDFKKNAS